MAPTRATELKKKKKKKNLKKNVFKDDDAFKVTVQ